MKYRLALLSALAAISLSGLGCVNEKPITDAVKSSLAPPPAPVEERPAWQPAGDGVERLEELYATSSQVRLVVYRFPTSEFEWRFDQGDPKRVGEWAGSNSSTSLVVNGVYFHDDQKPSGLMVSRGKRIGTRQFDLDKSGFIVLSPHVQILDTKKDKLDTKTVIEGAQSYPFLINDGKAAISSDSEKYARRSFFGLDQSGFAYVGVVPDEPVSLLELSKTLSKLDVKWDRVINLDGGPSTGLSYQSSSYHETLDSYTAVPNVIVVEKK